MRKYFLFALFFSLFLSDTRALEFRPFFERLSKLPPESHQYHGYTQGKQGLALGCGEGLIVPGPAGDWELKQPPKRGFVQCVLSIDRGLVVAGMGFCFLYDGSVWHDTGLVDEFIDGVSLGNFALLAGRKGAYQVNGDGSGKLLRGFDDIENRHFFMVEGRPILFAGAEGVWSWSGGQLHDATADFPWVGKRRVISIQPLPDGRFLASGTGGIFVVGGKTAESLFKKDTPTIMSKGLMSAFAFGDTVVVATYDGGLDGYSLSRGERLWSIDIAQLGGSLNFCEPYLDGLLVGTTNSLVVFPNPTKFAATPLAAGEVHFIASSRTGLFLSNSSEQVPIEGELPLPGQTLVFSFSETREGKPVAGCFGSVVIEGEKIEIGGRSVDRIFELNPQEFVILQPHGVSLLGRHQIPVLLNQLPPLPNTVARIDDETILVGTSEGAAVCSRTGVVERRFGSGLTRVFQVGENLVAGDARGTVYDVTGRVIASTALVEFVDATEANGKVLLLGRGGDGKFWLLQLDIVKGASTLDLPLPRVPQCMTCGRDGLYIVGVDSVVRYSALQETPRFDAPLRPSLVAPGGGGLASERVLVAPSVDTVGLQFPEPRLSPWPSARYSYRVEAGEWTSAGAGSLLPIQRLHYGNSRLQVRAEWATGSRTDELWVERRFPWWARWWSFALYGVAAAGGVLLLVRLRTRRIARKAAELENALDKRTVELKRALRAREDFFSTMSHEIRNPLNGVVGLCDMLDEAEAGAIGNRERYLVRTLRGCAAQLRSTLDDVLDFSRIDRGDIQLREEVFDLRVAVEGAARSIDAKLDSVRLDQPVSATWLRGDSGKIRQILCNLISNALKYGVPRVAEVKISVGLAGDSADLRLAVRNTGVTIPEEEQGKIFEGFSRGADAMRKRIPGSGIGLAVSRRMARAMNGDLWLRSENGLTEFALQLRLPVAEAPETRTPDSPVPVRVSKAMAIEDEDYNRLVLGSMLKNLGYEVDWAVDGASALELARTGSYDLVLTDFMLPDTTGVELVPKLLAIMQEPRPPVIAVTAYSTKEKIEQARAAGISGFVSKPIDIASLRAAIVAAAPTPPLRRHFDVAPAGRWNFDQMLKLADGKQLLAEYGASLPVAWKEVVAQFDDSGKPRDRAVKVVHAFVSRVLAVYAEDVGMQLKLLETAAADQLPEECRKLLSVISPMVDELAQAAAARALAY